MVALNEQYALKNPSLGSENRVGDFFMARGDRVGVEQPVSRIVIGEKYDAATRMASGHSKFANGAVAAAMVHLFNHEGLLNRRARANEARVGFRRRQIAGREWVEETWARNSHDLSVDQSGAALSGLDWGNALEGDYTSISIDAGGGLLERVSGFFAGNRKLLGSPDFIQEMNGDVALQRFDDYARDPNMVRLPSTRDTVRFIRIDSATFNDNFTPSGNSITANFSYIKYTTSD